MTKPKLIATISASLAARTLDKSGGVATHVAYAVDSEESPVGEGIEVGVAYPHPNIAGHFLIQLNSLPENGTIVLKPVN